MHALTTSSCGVAVLAAACLLRIGAAAATPPAADSLTLSVVSTTDIHGFVLPGVDRGGLALLAGYLRNLRSARAADGGAVLVVDAGDTFQGGIESNLSEGALVVDAFNAMGLDAAAIGNHEFDFGAIDRPGAREDADGDPHGAIRARAAQARYPLLAANLLDHSTGHMVDWANVRASVRLEKAGVSVGVVGVMTSAGLRSTIAANVVGLDLAPLAPTIAREAGALRSAGADVVVVVAHAGGGCDRFDDPRDLSSCDQDSEIFGVARALPAGLVDVIAAGHTHEALAHVVNGIAIVQAGPLGRAFARVDVTLDRASRRVTGVTPFAPRPICARQRTGSRRCADPDGDAPPVSYEGRPVHADRSVSAAMAPALARVRRLQATRLGVTLSTPVTRTGDTEPALANLFADALRERTGADVAISSSTRALRADLPRGPLTFGALYDVFPFDNRLLRMDLTGARLRGLLLDQVVSGRAGALGVSGMQVETACDPQGVRVAVSRPDGREVGNDDPLTLVTVAAPVPGPLLLAVPRPEPAGAGATPLVRELIEDWFRHRAGRLSADRFASRVRPRWHNRDGAPHACQAR